MNSHQRSLVGLWNCYVWLGSPVMVLLTHPPPRCYWDEPNRYALARYLGQDLTGQTNKYPAVPSAVATEEYQQLCHGQSTSGAQGDGRWYWRKCTRSWNILQIITTSLYPAFCTLIPPNSCRLEDQYCHELVLSPMCIGSGAITKASEAPPRLYYWC